MEITSGTYSVYAHINKTNGKTYIGITQREPAKRWQNGRGYIDNEYFWNAICKYGWNGFDHEIIASNLTKEEACNMERFLIEELHTTDRDVGYNLCAGGGLPPVTKGEANYFYNNHMWSGENHPFYGRHHTPETKKKMSLNHWDCSREKNPFYGNHMFADGKSPNCKKVQCVETGIVYDAILYAAQAAGVDRSGIRYALKDK